jgi:hypothetical protein
MIARRDDKRLKLQRKIEELAEQAVFGTLSETYRTCGTSSCRCHREGPKHGPHLYVSYRGEHGKTSGYYVPKAAEPTIRAAVASWHELQEILRKLATLNKDRALKKAREGRK